MYYKVGTRRASGVGDLTWRPIPAEGVGGWGGRNREGGGEGGQGGQGERRRRGRVGSKEATT